MSRLMSGVTGSCYHDNTTAAAAATAGRGDVTAWRPAADTTGVHTGGRRQRRDAADTGQ